MDAAQLVFAALNIALRELTLFAACGFLILGVGDLLVDLIWLAQKARRMFSRRRPVEPLRDEAPTSAVKPGLLAIFIPAWDESAVIGDMLRNALKALGGAEYRIYVGCYPNDPATIAAVAAFAGPLVTLVTGPVPGPTTKADCLNRLWERMREDEKREGRQVKAVILHDSEDVVHTAELAIVTGQ